MISDIYKACLEGDTNLVQALIQTSPDNVEINRLEPDGSTALHVACSEGFVDIVRLLLDDSRVDRHRRNKDGRSAYQVASTEEIRQLFRRPQCQTNPFCTNENLSSPFELIESTRTSDPRYIDVYRSDAPILTDLHSGVLHAYSDAWSATFDSIKCFFGYDPDKERFSKWRKDLQIHLEQCLIDDYLKRSLEPNYSSYSKANQCMEAFEQTREVEHLLKLYTIDITLSQYFAQNPVRTNCLHAPVSFALFRLEARAYKGKCFRGLRMKTTEFEKYQRALLQEKNYVRTNTFCSTSPDRSVAQIFADSGAPFDAIPIVMCINFNEACSTALSLFSCSPQLKCLSYYENEQEVLILPGTVFSVTGIQDDPQTESKGICLEHFNTDEEEVEMHQDRFQSFVDLID